MESFNINGSVLYKTIHINTRHKQNYPCLVYHNVVKYEKIIVMCVTIINVYVHSGNIYLCLMCAIADVNKRISSIFVL